MTLAVVQSLGSEPVVGKFYEQMNSAPTLRNQAGIYTISLVTLQIY